MDHSLESQIKLVNPNIDLSDVHFVAALENIFGTDRNISIDGKAGSGKTEIIKLVASILPNVLVCATTGKAALDLCSSKIASKTIHSLFEIKPYEWYDKNLLKFFMYNKKNREAILKADILIIDEVSMLSCNLFDFLMDQLMIYRSKKPIRVILFGDALQLPPVIDSKNQDLIALYQQYYNGNTMYFHSNWYKQLKIKEKRLYTSYRQSDKILVGHLQDLAFGNHTQVTLDYFNQQELTQNEFKSRFKTHMMLSSDNKKADQMNIQYKNSFNTKGYNYIATSSDAVKFFKQNKIIPADELIKVDTQVMCVKNGVCQKTKIPYANGMMGIVLDVQPDFVVIENKHGDILQVNRSRTQLYDAKVHKGKIEYVPGEWAEQIDCKTAYCCTVHKAQGATLDAAYMIMGPKAPPQPGLMYVALSRVKNLSDIGISRALVSSDIITNNEAIDYLTGMP